jgi:hypothetical protein
MCRHQRPPGRGPRSGRFERSLAPWRRLARHALLSAHDADRSLARAYLPGQGVRRDSHLGRRGGFRAVARGTGRLPVLSQSARQAVRGLRRAWWFEPRLRPAAAG